MAQPKAKKLDLSRLPKGVRKGKDNRWCYEFNRIQTDGTRYRKAGSCKTPEEAVAKLNLAIQSFEAGESNIGRAPTVGEWAEYVKNNILPVAPSRSGKPYSPRTVQGYVGIIDGTLKPLLGDVLLDKVTPEHVEAMLAKVGGSPQTRLNVRNLGSLLYEVAARRGKIRAGLNPFKAILIAKPKRVRDTDGNEVHSARVLTQDEEEALLRVTKDLWCHGAILLGLRLGLRMGEVLGLEWTDIDWDGEAITINQQRQRVTARTRELMNIKSKGGLLKLSPKSDWGYRMIPLPKSVMAWLKEEQARNTSIFIIPNDHGNNPKEPRRLTACFTQAVVNAKIGTKDSKGKPLPLPTFHDLRHTWCTRHATVYKTTPNVLMRLAGHSRVETTLGYYVHTDDGDLFAAMSHIP